MATIAGSDFAARLAEFRNVGAPSLMGYCTADGMTIDIQPMNGDFDVDPPMLDILLAQAVDASVGPGSVIANTTAAVNAATQAVLQRNARLNLQRMHERIAAGTLRSARINAHMTLYNANQGKGRPRVRVRVTNLPVKVMTPIGLANGAWRTNRAGTTHSAAWRDPSPATVNRAAAVASEMSWNARMGWLTGRTGTGIITFAPTAAIDAWNSAEWDVDTAGRRHYQRMDWDEFAVRSARNQSGNVVGVVAGTVATTALAKGALGVGVAAAVAGAPLVLIGLAVGITAVFVWNATGMSDRVGDWTERQLGR